LLLDSGNYSEEIFLECSNKYRLPQHTVMNIIQSAKQDFFENKFNSAMADKMISPEVASELKRLVGKLEINFNPNEQLKVDFERKCLIWYTLNKGFKPKQVAINLQLNEECYFSTSCDLMELRGRYSKLTKIDTGLFYLTNKRIVFTGAIKNVSFKPDKILDYKFYKDGIELIRDSGKNQFFGIERDLDLLMAVITRLKKPKAN